MPPKSDVAIPKTAVRRSASQPKSSRQQFSACGACRIRRVRCDLKDLPPNSSVCTNCQEHGFNCVDEYRDVKSVKLLRRGRRIQQVEAVYGAGNSPESEQPDPSSRQSASGSRTPNYSVIPRLNPQFFASRFYPRFHIQRPIIEPEEFKARYTAFFNGNAEALGIAGQLIAMILVVWAASYGVDEFGIEEPHDGAQGVRRRKQRTNEMANELLHLIDIHGLPRKPSWDGVRVLLLVMPLTEEVAQPLERLTMYETAINQVYTLCSLASPRSVNSGQGEYVDALVRARIYWYAFVHEGITTGLRGGRLHLADDDLAAFQKSQEGNDASLARSQLTLTYSRRWALAPLRLATACREVHSALVGAKARARPDVDVSKLHQAWESIENCWEEFESLRKLGLLGILTVEDADRFVDGWKIFIFECHNVIRESLKERLVAASGGHGAYLIDTENPQGSLNSLIHLHAIAESKCQDVVQHVVSLVRRHLGTSFFEYDASLVRDGCFFAGYILAGESGTEEQCNVCLQALSEMRWAFSKSEERAQTLKLIYEGRRRAAHPIREDLTPPFGPPPHTGPEHAPPSMHRHYGSDLENREWSTTAGRDPNAAASSPAVPSTSRLPEEYPSAYRSSSMSSRSSAPSTDPPDTPATQHMAPSSYTLPPDFDTKTRHATHAHTFSERNRGPALAPTVGPPSERGASSNACYQFEQQPVYSHNLVQHQPHHPGITFSQPSVVGPDGLLYVLPPHDAAGAPHPAQGDGHPYPNDTPYFYS